MEGERKPLDAWLKSNRTGRKLRWISAAPSLPLPHKKPSTLYAQELLSLQLSKYATVVNSPLRRRSAARMVKLNGRRGVQRGRESTSTLPIITPGVVCFYLDLKLIHFDFPRVRFAFWYLVYFKRYERETDTGERCVKCVPIQFLKELPINYQRENGERTDCWTPELCSAAASKAQEQHLVSERPNYKSLQSLSSNGL